VLLTSEDNRAVSEVAPSGALVKMTVELGEPRSVSALHNEAVPFSPSGIPTCTADLRLGTVSCSGLVSGARYLLTRMRGSTGADRRARANAQGALRVSSLPGPVKVQGGDRLSLRNASGRVLTTLHVAHLRVALDGNQTVVSSGVCQPGDYWGAPLTSEPSSAAVGEPGSAGLGTVCPADGHAHGMPTSVIAQTDDLSGGLTETSVPVLEGEAPLNDETVYGAFRALAQTGVAGANGSVLPASATVALKIALAGSPATVWSSPDVAAAQGVPVANLPAGVYNATWVVRDANGDTRTVKTTFIQAG
jgi:hypothetical protein